ncbi:hypothetical protein [Jannaschia sp. W003]|uniref:hypothetical protein n=1 Tax=Jannaschia sp. W003 TaxID=2867012 RepID=UPI0021A8BDB7|nr:hypothetical protein [Jannaschia sp. W003]UWQ19990.1 hypothetical protein K3554_08145 [Jannaschia sp. W003]
MRYFITFVAALALAGPAVAGHKAGTPPGQAAQNGGDVNGNGRTNGQDYAPGQTARTDPSDENGDGRSNGKDFAPGQYKD